MTLVHNASKFTNKQQLRMQENPDSIPDGETPHTVSLSLFDELVDIAKPGDRVEVTGVFRAVSMRVAPNQRTLRSIYKTYIDVIHVRKARKAQAPPRPPHSRRLGPSRPRSPVLSALRPRPQCRLPSPLAPER